MSQNDSPGSPLEGQPLVSVLMPTFQQEHFIRRALDSLLAQSFTGWELLIIDDGSKDRTSEVARPYLADRRIRYRRLEQNQGLGAALNQGLSLAKGSLIAY